MASLGSLLRAGAVLGALVASAPASAAVVDDWGTLGPNSVGSYGQTVSAGNSTTTFAHDYAFGLSGNASLKSVVLNFNAFAPRNIIGLQAMLFSTNGTTDTLLASTSIGDGSLYETIKLAYANLNSATDYFIRIVGTVTRGTLGTYAGVYELSPVPLPPALWLFGSAIIGLAAIGRQRRAARNNNGAIGA